MSARRAVFQAFGLLPRSFRRVLIRTIQPSWTAGAVAMLERDDGRFLFVKPVYRDGWTLPGGLVDRGEDPAATVVREMREELSVAVEVVGEPMVIVDPTYRRLETLFRVNLVDGSAPDSFAITTPELSGLAWHPLDDLPDVEPETAAVLELVRDAMAGGPTARIRRDL